ncbi:MAG: transglutaminase N-terminal domain-containing protein, partial [Vulcanimicrobiota bacterium]
MTHQTRYLYSEKVSISYNRVHSRPRLLAAQSSENCKLLIQPEPASIDSERDFFGNPIAFFTVQKPHRELEVTVSFDAEVKPRETPGPGEEWERVVSRLQDPRQKEAMEASQFR